METTSVLIAGGGPTGLMLACELRLAGIDVLVVDRLAARGRESRAGGMHPRTLELLDQRGMLAPFQALGTPIQGGHFAGIPVDFSRFDTRFPYTLMLLQSKVERLLEARLAELGGQVRWSSEITRFDSGEGGITVELDGSRKIRADYLVGCDGGRGAVRKLAGIGFDGTEATMSSLLGDVELAEPPAEPFHQKRAELGHFSVLEFEPGWYRVIVSEYGRVLDRHAEVDVEELRATLIRVAGTDFGLHRPRWISHFGNAARLAERYRAGRVLLAGDAAHIHAPAGGQGMNTGIQDAVNLGWKLALVVSGRAPQSLLDSYEAERRPVADRVLRNTRAQTLLSGSGPHIEAVRETVAALIATEAGNDTIGTMVSALDLRYPAGEGHPLLGRRVPDLDLKTADGPVRLYELLHRGRPVLLDFGAGAGRPEGWADRVDHVEAVRAVDRWAVPGVGEIPVAAALLVRPDGCVVWLPEAGVALRTALTTWFGPAQSRSNAGE
ncbi:FAD-dependent monooxygenase [Amycolatopsis sp. PS_44_ISF1]|uniref:FAD-dependent monooxygenase n=1 Tax=Amycolatopsis sp. PS_44_ISF1 TaxID=2974917 RepID=UPI0028E095FD|nr:FAD-dependent monooxygenase [Amycolatopsis sp. PS_44_ISF1]MDT8911587.1 FAD-dependent monooxygenase [Amycolatopsis sp. PS_44_ISF1]